MISRRGFLRDVSLALAVAGVAKSALGWAGDQTAPVIEGKSGMIVQSYRFLDLEMPPEFANSWLTPVPHFFVRNHMFEPTVLDASSWELKVSGEVANPLTLKLTDIVARDQHSVPNTLECAGNGRAFHSPKVPGVQWERGAVGTGRFRGARLADILTRAGVKSTGKHVMLRGMDEVPGKVPPFVRSIPIEKAMDPDTLIATQMNGAALAKHHGFPARVLVPGWIGAASCKWVTEINVLDKEFEGNFMKPGYRMPNQPVPPGGTVNPEDTHPVTALNVKSLIATPSERAKLKRGAVHIQGVAWAGEADVVKVEVSTDGGTTWIPAVLGKQQARYTWRMWSYSWKPTHGGDFAIMSRATDSQGRVQPDVAAWNPSGYLYNAVDRVNVHVEA